MMFNNIEFSVKKPQMFIWNAVTKFKEIIPSWFTSKPFANLVGSNNHNISPVQIGQLVENTEALHDVYLILFPL